MHLLSRLNPKCQKSIKESRSVANTSCISQQTTRIIHYTDQRQKGHLFERSYTVVAVELKF